MDKTYELFHNGLLRTIKFKTRNEKTTYETIEFSIHQTLTDENGKVIVDNGNTYFFEPRQFEEFFTPIINDMKARFDNANNASEPNT